MANFPIDETQKAVNQELRKIETSDPVHADVYNALLEQLINNDAFLERLAKEMIRQSMISHVLDSVNPNMVLGADVGPKITEITEALQQSITVLNTNLTTMWNSGLTYGANFDFKTGGYLKVGNLVVVALSLNIKSDIAETSYVDAVFDLPLPIVEAALAIWTFNTAAANLNKCRIMPYNNGGLVYVYGALITGAPIVVHPLQPPPLQCRVNRWESPTAIATWVNQPLPESYVRQNPFS